MNERIQDLGIEAGLYVDLNGSPWPRAMSAEECQAAYAKFAELIVRECLAIARHREDELEDAGLLKESNAAGIVAYRIARQFGVKE